MKIQKYVRVVECCYGMFIAENRIEKMLKNTNFSLEIYSKQSTNMLKNISLSSERITQKWAEKMTERYVIWGLEPMLTEYSKGKSIINKIVTVSFFHKRKYQ